MKEKFYLTNEFRANYSQWVTLFKGHEENNTVLICNDTMSVETSVFLSEIIIDQHVDGHFDVDDYIISNDINYYSLPDGYDGKEVWSRVREITQDEVNVLLKVLQENDTNDDKGVWLKRMDDIKECNNVHDFMNKYYTCLNIMSNTIDISKVTFMSNSLLEAMKVYRENMRKIAEEKNEKQCIFIESGRIDEFKGMYIKKECIYPDGRKEKKEGWEYEI